MNAGGQKNAENIEDHEKSTNSYGAKVEEGGWTKVISKKRKIPNKKAAKACNIDCGANSSNSDDSFVSFEKPKKKKVNKSKTKKCTSHTSKCPVCMKSLKSVLQHLNKSKACKSKCTEEQLNSGNNFQESY